MTASERHALPTLLTLPTEIRLQIWKYAFGQRHLPVYSHHTETRYSKQDDPSRSCEACKTSSLPAAVRSPHEIYNHALNQLLASKTVFNEAIDTFQSTLTLHVKTPETIAYVRSTASSLLRERIKRIVLYIHFDHDNHFLWCMRLFELQAALPALTHINVEYHMRPPSSYNNVLDVVLFYMPILELGPSLSPPRFVAKSDSRLDHTRFYLDQANSNSVIPCTDHAAGLTIHTSYMKHERLFDAEWLGEIWTNDAIDEHTGVVRDLFHDARFVAAAHHVVMSNRQAIDAWVSASYPPDEYSSTVIERGLPDKTYVPALHEALVQVARRHERPFFEKLQKRRIVEIYRIRSGMTRAEAERLLDRQLQSLPEGQGIENFIERMMNNDETEDPWQAMDFDADAELQQ